jgi:PAS domain S-box-containing protein
MSRAADGAAVFDLLDSVEDYAICILDPGGAIVSWNSGGERLFGYHADDIIGRDYSSFFTPIERRDGIPAAHLLSALGSGRHRVERPCIRHDGSAFDANVLLAAIRHPDGSHRGFSLVVRDITERKRLENDLRRRAEDLEAANRAKEEFLATLSHELRTPLNAMLGWTRLLRSGKLDERAMARALETIERNAHIQEQLIADILDVSRIVTGKLRVALRPIEIAPLVQAAVDAVRPAADAKGVALGTAGDGAGTIMGDPDRLQQAIWNLLSNAIKFTSRGGRVAVSAGRVGPNAVIEVSDTGEGIAPGVLPYVFDRFRQGDASATRLHGGLGLGLSLVRHIVELHGGQVEARSGGTGKGATFVVQLPVRAVQHVEDQGGHPAPLAGVKVLVVDDDPDAREVVSLALTQCGARTAVAASAQEAVQMIAAFGPDVVISDIAMPGEDGYSLVRKLHGMASDVDPVPVVALTGVAGADARRRALGAGFQHFVPKPVEVNELAAVVRTVVERHRG